MPSVTVPSRSPKSVMAGCDVTGGRSARNASANSCESLMVFVDYAPYVVITIVIQILLGGQSSMGIILESCLGWVISRKPARH